MQILIYILVVSISLIILGGFVAYWGFRSKPCFIDHLIKSYYGDEIGYKFNSISMLWDSYAKDNDEMKDVTKFRGGVGCPNPMRAMMVAAQAYRSSKYV